MRKANTEKDKQHNQSQTRWGCSSGAPVQTSALLGEQAPVSKPGTSTAPGAGLGRDAQKLISSLALHKAHEQSSCTSSPQRKAHQELGLGQTGTARQAPSGRSRPAQHAACRKAPMTNCIGTATPISCFERLRQCKPVPARQKMPRERVLKGLASLASLRSNSTCNS